MWRKRAAGAGMRQCAARAAAAGRGCAAFATDGIIGEQHFFSGDIFGGVEKHAGHEGDVGLRADVGGASDGQQAAKHFERVDAGIGDDVIFDDLARVIAIGEGAVADGAVIDGDDVGVGVAAGQKRIVDDLAICFGAIGFAHRGDFLGRHASCFDFHGETLPQMRVWPNCCGMMSRF